jgi:hypothetical protein
VAQWLEDKGEEVGIIIRGNEAADKMAAEAVLLPDHRKYVPLGQACCLLYHKEAPLEDLVWKVLGRGEKVKVESDWHDLLGWSAKDEEKWSLGASLKAMTRPRHYNEWPLNCLTRYCMGATALAQQVFDGHREPVGECCSMGQVLEERYGQGMCKWCASHCDVTVQEDKFHFLATCLVYEEIRVDTIRRVSTLYRDQTGCKLQWAHWMGIDLV